MENNVACYEGIQRVFRNAVVRFLRETMTKTFPTEYETLLKKPFKKEWDGIKENAYLARDAFETESKIIDDFDLLSVNHFFNIFDAFYYELLQEDSQNTAHKRRKQNLLSWVKSVKNLRDPLSHPGEEDFSFEDSFSLLDCARRTLLVLGLSDEAEKLKTIMSSLNGGHVLLGKEEKEPLEDRLPPIETIVQNFVGREHELKELRNWFYDPVSKRWALAGEGGKGKSAIAYKLGIEIKFAAPKLFNAVFWLSAKKKQYIEGSVIEISNPDFYDLSSAVDKLLEYYGWIEDIELPIETKKEKTLVLLNEFPALIIVDDIDSLESQNEDVIEYFSLNLPQTKSKVLFTSRRTIFGMGGSTTHVEGFTLEDTHNYVASRSFMHDQDINAFPKSMIAQIHKVTEGSPLYIEDLMRLTAVMPPKNAIELWQQKGGKEARRYALGRECDMLSETARKVLFAGCISRGFVSFAELEEILGMNSERLAASINELQKLFLVPKPRIIEGEQRFDININTRTLVKEVYGDTDNYRRVDLAYKKISGQVRQKSSSQIGAIIRQALFHLRAKKFQEAESLLLNAKLLFPADTDVLGVLGLIYKSWAPPRITDAREHFMRAHQLKSAKEEMYIHWSRMEIEGSEWTKAAIAAESGIKFANESRKLHYYAGYARSRLGKEFTQQLQNEKAEKQFKEAKAHLNKALKPPEKLESGERNLNADIYRALILLCESTREDKLMSGYFDAWKKEHPDDSNACTEWDRLAKRFCLRN